jgi:hypothetical protein
MSSLGGVRVFGRGEVIDFARARRRHGSAAWRSRQVARRSLRAIAAARPRGDWLSTAGLVAFAFGVAALSAPVRAAFGLDACAALWIGYAVSSAIIYSDLAERAPVALGVAWAAIAVALAITPAALPGAVAMALAFGGALLMRRSGRA